MERASVRRQAHRVVEATSRMITSKVKNKERGCHQRTPGLRRERRRRAVVVAENKLAN